MCFCLSFNYGGFWEVGKKFVFVDWLAGVEQRKVVC